MFWWTELVGTRPELSSPTIEQTNSVEKAPKDAGDRRRPESKQSKMCFAGYIGLLRILLLWLNLNYEGWKMFLRATRNAQSRYMRKISYFIRFLISFHGSAPKAPKILTDLRVSFFRRVSFFARARACMQGTHETRTWKSNARSLTTVKTY